MKHSKPTNSATNSSPRPPREISTRAQLRELQRVMGRRTISVHSRRSGECKSIGPMAGACTTSRRSSSSRTTGSAPSNDWRFTTANTGSASSIVSMTTIRSARNSRTTEIHEAGHRLSGTLPRPIHIPSATSATGSKNFARGTSVECATTRTRARYGAFRMGTDRRIRWPCQAASYSRRHPRYPTVEAAFRFAALSFVARAGLRCR